MKYSTFGFKAAVLSLSLLTIMAGAGVAAGVEKIGRAFPNAPETLIKLVISLPSLFIIISALLVGIFGQHIKKKPLIVCGLALFLIGGVGASFTHSIEQLLLFRAVLGFGTGIILPFSTGLIAACYEGTEKSKMMGYSFATNNLGAMTANIMAGILALISWRYMFQVYWLALITLILVLLFLNQLPDSKVKLKSSEDSLSKPPEKLPPRVFRIALYGFGIMMVFYMIATNLALIITERKMGTSQVSGYIFALNTFIMLCAGILLPFSMRLKKYFIPVGFLLVAAGFFGISKSSTLSLMIFSNVLSGAGVGSLFPYLLNLASDKIPESLSFKAMSITMVFAWFGQFLSPLFFGFVSSLTGLDISNMFLSISIVFLILTVGSSVINLRKTADLSR